MQPTLNTQKIIRLTPPLFSSDNIKEKIICIRAHRERIFQVSTEIKDEKYIFHNYGQGGAGWTFLFGCVQESVRQFEAQLAHNSALKNKPICVIGAGCYGLLTAIILARARHAVHIVAAEIDNIPSNKAAGFFFPRWRKSSTPEEIALFTSFGIESYATYQTIAQGTHPFIAQGPKYLPVYYGLDIDPGFTPYIQQGLMAAPHQVTIDFGNGKIYEVNQYTSIFINTAQIMQELKRNINALSIDIVTKEIEHFSDITESIIFNCAGLGAKKLTDDKKIIPVQGHLITLKNQPDMASMQYMVNVKVTMTNADGRQRDELIYYAPKESGIVGITFIRNQNSLTANQYEFDRLLQRCHDFFGT